MGAEKGMRFPSVLEPTPTRPRGETGAFADGSASALPVGGAGAGGGAVRHGNDHEQSPMGDG